MTTSRIDFITVAAGTEVQIVGPNQRRKSLMITFSNATSPIYVRNNSLGVVIGGLAISGNSGILVISREEHGDIIEQPFWADCPAVGTIGFMETID